MPCSPFLSIVLSWGMPAEAVPKVRKLQTEKGLKSRSQNLEAGLVLHWKPVRLAQNWLGALLY